MQVLKRTLKNMLFENLRERGYHIQRISSHQRHSYEDFHKQAQIICERHWEQSKETATALKKKYEKPVFGKVRVWNLIERLGKCIDSGDRTLYCTSQLAHVLQILEGMERDGISDPDMFIAALVHDIGKVLLLTGEAPENVVGGHHQPIGDYEEGIGLDNCILQWDHGEFAYSRLKDYLPDHVAWLVRYHTILSGACAPFMDERDRTYTERYFHTFHKYDFGTKSPYFLAKTKLEKYRDLVEQTFPEPILF